MRLSCGGGRSMPPESCLSPTLKGRVTGRTRMGSGATQTWVRIQPAASGSDPENLGALIGRTQPLPVPLPKGMRTNHRQGPGKLLITRNRRERHGQQGGAGWVPLCGGCASGPPFSRWNMGCPGDVRTAAVYWLGEYRRTSSVLTGGSGRPGAPLTGWPCMVNLTAPESWAPTLPWL